ncbi:MAG TPA: DegV family protein [Dehalococcoidia bacterium]|nr:DegV family protein [Dehalococcoidia bacterium]
MACLNRELVEEYGIGIIPLNFYAGGRLYKDWLDVTPSEAYELFLRDPDSFKTAASSPEDCLNAFSKARQVAKNIVCVTVSVKLSAVYNVARKAKEIIENEHPDTRIEVVDSHTATPAEGFVALAAAHAAREEKDMPEVISAALEMRERVNVIALLDTIKHVYRSGRIPKIAAKFGSILNIRPIFTVSDTIHFAGIVRNRKRGIDRILQVMREKVGNKVAHVAVMHAYAPEEAEKLKERVAAEFKCAELWLTEFSPLMGYACGTGTLGLAFYAED